MNLIFFDIDGTLAQGKKVPESAQEAIRHLRQNGDLVFICTGRWRSYAEHHFSQYADGFICSNGRLAFRGKEILYDYPLTREQIMELVRRLDDAGADYLFYGEEEAYYGGNPQHAKEHTAFFEGGSVKGAVDPEKNKVYSFDVFFQGEEHIRRIEEALKDLGIVNRHGSHPSGDVTILGVDKGYTLRKVANHLGVPIENTYAFGDGSNDICMMQAAGHGIAMGNAVDEVKEHAEFVTADILKDGVKLGLEHYGLV